MNQQPLGKRPEEREAILHDLAEVEPLLRATCTAEIDASAPIDRVVQQLEELARMTPWPGAAGTGIPALRQRSDRPPKLLRHDARKPVHDVVSRMARAG
ncbi:hypothetical protein [Streptosporangium sandarakinum]|uniref:hypothetical protein n=1 Tax=Streptosporangium sandarakinum TaxID=1260955 RepID=UPI0036847A86